ncbi:MAG: hypothetical protein CMM93_02020 [Rickettsiales bacterium]|nr:hypothetical protein [Rickettsiales bacterium]|tara:strand:+ start:771 stop:1241 length:471 start_codon:yes stop_codon:yes gene_type:complete
MQRKAQSVTLAKVAAPLGDVLRRYDMLLLAAALMLLLSACAPSDKPPYPAFMQPIVDCIAKKDAPCLEQYTDSKTRLSFGAPEDATLLQDIQNTSHPLWADLATIQADGCTAFTTPDATSYICPPESVWQDDLGYRMIVKEDANGRPYILSMVAGD